MLKRCSEACFNLEGANPGPYEGTMRGSDPCLPPQIRAYMDGVRDDAARYYAFAVPTKDAAKTLKDHGIHDILEVGSGNGFWAYVLRQQGLKVIASDVAVQKENVYHPSNLPRWCSDM